MLAVTFADLRFRARQFAIAIIGVGLVLSMALLLSGLASGFRAEVAGTVNGFNADSWVLSKSAQGRITAFAAFPEFDALAVQNEVGPRDASSLLVAPFQVVQAHGQSLTVNVVGVIPGRLGDPAVISGHRLSAPDDAVVNSRLNLPLGTHLALGRHDFTVVGTVSGRTLVGGASLVYVPLSSAQADITGGQPLITAVITSRVPANVPPGLVRETPEQVINASVGQLKSAVSSIDSTRWLMWLIAAVIVAAMLYVAALERKQDFAVLKALGSSSRALFLSLTLEAVIVTLLATVLAELLANVLTPLFSQPIDITLGAYETLPLVAVIVGIVASIGALRRVTGADPAAAFA